MNQLCDRRVFGLLGAVVDGNPTEEMMQAAFGAAGLPWKYVSLAIPQGSFAARFPNVLLKVLSPGPQIDGGGGAVLFGRVLFGRGALSCLPVLSFGVYRGGLDIARLRPRHHRRRIRGGR